MNHDMSCFLSYDCSPGANLPDVLGPRLHARARGRERESKVDILKNLLKYSIILTAPLDILTSFTTLTADDLFTFSPVRSLLSGMRTFNCLASDFLRGEVSSDFSNISCSGRSNLVLWRLVGARWKSVFSTSQHGFSLRSLYRKFQVHQPLWAVL